MKPYYNTLSGVAAVAAFVLISCGGPKTETKEETTATTVAAPTENVLSDAEKADGWELLFDGTTLNGWKRYNADSIGPLWTVDNGTIKCDGQGLTEGTKNVGGSLTTLKKFGNFELTVDWMLTPGGNSGILYHVIENPKYKSDYETGPECQIMDDNGWKDKLTDKQKAGSNYDMFAAAANKKVNPVGEWNTAKVIYNNGHVEHWLNGVKVVEFEEGSAAYKEAYKVSKWTHYPDWNKSTTGSICLQDHGAPVHFRNVKIKVLS